MYTPYRAQKSLFLRQTAELRNCIYKFVAENEKVLRPIDSSCLDGHKAYVPPLSLACRQTREEYRGIYLSCAPRCAGIVDVDLNTYSRYSRGPFGRTLGDVLQPYVNITDTLIIRMRLDNTWSMDELHRFSGTWLENDYCCAPWSEHNRLRGPDPPHEFIVEFDRRAFDVNHCYEELGGLERSSVNTVRLTYYDAWPKLEDAFREAFERHERQLLAWRKAGPRRRKLARTF